MEAKNIHSFPIKYRNLKNLGKQTLGYCTVYEEVDKKTGHTCRIYECGTVFKNRRRAHYQSRLI